ncbi:MAG TPA: cytochrome c, partial [Thermodesulfobacteriota bacterium]|nr:cytochrome c [Thermodesulfobacteriota bacterium]
TGESVVKKAGDLESGKRIYETYCHFCHGRTGLGDGPVGIAITPHPADFVHDTKRMSNTDEELFKSITEGIHKEIGGEEMAMPRWAEILSEKERWDVIHYIRKLESDGKEAEKEGTPGAD